MGLTIGSGRVPDGSLRQDLHAPNATGRSSSRAIDLLQIRGPAFPWFEFLVPIGASVILGCGTVGSPVPETSKQKAIFREVADAVGLNFRHFIGSTGEFFLPEIMGAGGALVDYDRDGDLDVYLLQGAALDPSKSPGSTRFAPPQQHWPGNRLFRNELVPTGSLSFTDVTDAAGVGHQGYGQGATVGDFDNDGDADIYVTNFGSNVLYRNNADGTFSDITRQAGVDDPRWSAGAAFLDYDRDGALDLFVTNYVDFTIRNNKVCYDPTGGRDYCNPAVYGSVPDKLFHNERTGRFTDVSDQAGIGTAFGNGLGVVCADFDSDGWIDIYVANDGNPNQLWRNQGDGTFEDVALMAGVAYNANGLAEASMGVTVGDFDTDGDEDLFVTHLALETNTLYLNNGSGLFHDVTNQMSLGGASATYTGFGTEFLDYDNDGFLDLFVANGAVTNIASLRGSPYPFHQRNQLFRGLGLGRFVEVNALGGSALALSEVSRGAAFGDIDQDGDVDVLVTNNNGPARLLLNDVGSDGHSLRVRLEGVESSREGIGARVAVFGSGPALLWKRVHSDGSYLSASDATLHFGLGDDAAVQGIGVVWPNGKREIWRDIPSGATTLREGTGEPWESDP